MIRATKLKLYIRAMRARGFSVDQTLEGARINIEKLYDADYLIDIWQAKKVIANIIRLTNNHPVTLTLANDLEISDLGILGHALATCESLDQAARLWKIYSPSLLGQMVSSDLIQKHDELHVVFSELYPLGPLLRFCVEENLIFGKFIGENMLKAPFVFSKLSVAYPKPSYHRVFETLLECPVEFNANINRITISAPLAVRNSGRPDTELHQVCLRQCEKVRENIRIDRPWASRVRTLLSGGNMLPNLSQVAEALHSSERSLRRHLQDEGASFQRIVNEHRFDMAREYLTGTRLSNQEIGFLLGYSDTKAFFRAFKEWAGCTVKDYREISAKRAHS